MKLRATERGMAKVGLQRAAELTGKSRSTIHRAMNAGRLSYEKNESGERLIDVSELTVRHANGVAMAYAQTSTRVTVFVKHSVARAAPVAAMDTYAVQISH